MEQYLRRTKTPVIIVSHSIAVGAGIMYVKDIAVFDRREHPVDREFVIVFAEGTRDVIFFRAGKVFLSKQYDDRIRTWRDA